MCAATPTAAATTVRRRDDPRLPPSTATWHSSTTAGRSRSPMLYVRHDDQLYLHGAPASRALKIVGSQAPPQLHRHPSRRAGAGALLVPPFGQLPLRRRLRRRPAGHRARGEARGDAPARRPHHPRARRGLPLVQREGAEGDHDRRDVDRRGLRQGARPAAPSTTRSTTNSAIGRARSRSPPSPARRSRIRAATSRCRHTSASSRGWARAFASDFARAFRPRDFPISIRSV